MTERGLDPEVAAWIRGFAPRAFSRWSRAVWVTDFDLAHGFGRTGPTWQVLFRERGDPVRVLAAGEREHLQRYLVWRVAATAQAAAGRGSTSYPVAPERVPAVEGPLRVRSEQNDPGGVWEGDQRVASFESRGEAVEFTHYGWVPAPVLIAKITGPVDEMVFTAGARYRTDADQVAEAHRIRQGLLALLGGHDPS